MKPQLGESGWPTQISRCRASVSQCSTSLCEIPARLDRLPSLQTLKLDRAVCGSIHDVAILDSRYYLFSSITCFKYSGISDNGSNRTSILPSAVLRITVFTFAKRSSFSG